jgi:hypothetical protein
MSGSYAAYAQVGRDPIAAKTGVFTRIGGINISAKTQSVAAPAPGSNASQDPTLYRHDIPRDPAFPVNGKDPSRTIRAGEPVLFVGSTVGTGGTYGKAIPLVTTILNGRGRLVDLEKHELEAFAGEPGLLKQWKRMKAWWTLRAALRPIGISAFDAHSESSNELVTVARNAAIHTVNNSNAPIKLFQRVAVELPINVDLDDQLKPRPRSPGELGNEQVANVEDRGVRRKPIVMGVTVENSVSHHIAAWDLISHIPVPPTPDPRYNNPHSLAAIPRGYRMYELLTTPALIHHLSEALESGEDINKLARDFVDIKQRFIKEARQSSAKAAEILSQYTKSKKRLAGDPKDGPFIDFLLAVQKKSPLASTMELSHEIIFEERQNHIGTAISASDGGAPLYLAQNSQ